MPLPPVAYTGRFVWFCLDICKKNQSIVLEHRYAKQAGWQPEPLLCTTPLLGCASAIHTTAATSPPRIEMQRLWQGEDNMKCPTALAEGKRWDSHRLLARVKGPFACSCTTT
jgi:hypothetical protein